MADTSNSFRKSSTFDKEISTHAFNFTVEVTCEENYKVHKMTKFFFMCIYIYKL